MKKGYTIALGVFGLMLGVVLIIAVILDRRFELLWAAPVISHDTLATPETRVKIVITPALLEDQLPQLLPQSQVPYWMIRMALPREIAILSDADVAGGAAGITFFVNDRRLGPFLRDAVNRSRLRAAIPGLRWSPTEMTAEKRGRLTLSGSIPIESATRETVRAHWPRMLSLDALSLEGNHLLEAMFDNRDGGAFAILASLARPQTPTADLYADKNIMALIAGASNLHITADLADAGAATVNLRLSTNPKANVIFALKLTLDATIQQLKESVRSTYGIGIEGVSTVEGDAIKGAYTVTNVDQLFQNLVNRPPTG